MTGSGYPCARGLPLHSSASRSEAEQTCAAVRGVRPAGWLGFFWTLPNTLLGLLLGGLTFQAPRAHGGAIVFDRVPRGLTRLLRAMHRTAMTVGFVIVAAVPVEGRLLVHERHHIRQYMMWGRSSSRSTCCSRSRSATAGTQWSGRLAERRARTCETRGTRS